MAFYFENVLWPICKLPLISGLIATKLMSSEGNVKGVLHVCLKRNTITARQHRDEIVMWSLCKVPLITGLYQPKFTAFERSVRRVLHRNTLTGGSHTADTYCDLYVVNCRQYLAHSNKTHSVWREPKGCHKFFLQVNVITGGHDSEEKLLWCLTSTAMVPMVFFIDIILPVARWPWNWLSL
jgi:hypothetical protein